MKYLNIYILPILYEAISTFFVYLSKSDFPWNYFINHNILNQNINVKLGQELCLVFSIILSFVFLTIALIRKNIAFEDVNEQRVNLIIMYKDFIGLTLRQYFTGFSDFSIRIFVQKNRMMYHLLDKVPFTGRLIAKRSFVIRNVDFLANTKVSNNLEFEVLPHPQGLVGKCFNEKSLIFDDDLKRTNSVEYNLSQMQISKTSNLEWSICFPILDNNNDIIAIIALDGTKAVKFKSKKLEELSRILLPMLNNLYESIPQLFE